MTTNRPRRPSGPALVGYYALSLHYYQDGSLGTELLHMDMATRRMVTEHFGTTHAPHIGRRGALGDLKFAITDIINLELAQIDVEVPGQTRLDFDSID